MSAEENQLVEMVAAFEREWQVNSTPPNLGAYLARCDAHLREASAKQLFPIEIEYRLQSNNQINVERDYANLSAALREQFAEQLQQAIRSSNATTRVEGLTESNELSGTGTPDFKHPVMTERPTVGPYRLLQLLGEGGMGSVWLAEQSVPVKRRVALKLIRSNLGSQEVLARFEAERQALAMMNHPNIARIIDAGTAPDGQPYFAMELVQGASLTKYCDQNRLDINERLKLFAEVCAGVQHAHQKGIIHRDLKPSNILVTLVDGSPVPKVIDFGLAKAIEATNRLTDQSLFTHIGQVLGTVKYMSPEQAGLNELDVDTRTDIYSLGVILYELLTGSTPLDDDSLRNVVGIKILEAVREFEPVKPSSRLSNRSAPQLSSVTNCRRTDTTRLTRILTGDLDWIVMKTLDKDRTRRYDSASGFAADIQRYLGNEPVTARPPSIGYRASKFLKKNRGFVSACLLLLFTLTLGLAGTSWGLLNALKAQEKANALAASEQAARDRIEIESAQRMLALEKEKAALRLANEETEAKEQALANEKNQRKYAVAIANFVIDDFLALTSVEGQARFAEPEANNLHRNSTLQDLLGRAAGKLSQRDDLDQKTEAELCWIIGVSYRAIGEAEKAISFLLRCLELRQSMEPQDAQKLILAQNSLAAAYGLAGDTSRASPLYAAALRSSVELNGVTHPISIKLKSFYAHNLLQEHRVKEAVALLEECLAAVQELGEEFSYVAVGIKSSLASAARQQGDSESALKMYRDAFELCESVHGRGSFWSLECMEGMALANRDLGNLKQAALIMEQQLELTGSLLGRDHPSTNDSISNLGTVYIEMGRYEEAAKLFEESLDWTVRNLGENHSNSLTTLTNLSTTYELLGRREEALEMQEKTLQVIIDNKGANDPMALAAMNSLATTYRAVGRFEEALKMSQGTLKTAQKVLGEKHLSTLVLMVNLARSYDLSNRPNESIETYETTLQALQEKVGEQHPTTLACAKNLAAVYGKNRREDDAFKLFDSTLAAMRETLGESHANTLACKWEYAQLHQQKNQWEKAIVLIREIYETPDRPSQFSNAGWHLLMAHAAAKNQQEAIDLVKELLPEIRTTQQADPTKLSNSLTTYAGVLMDVEAYDDAALLLRECLALSQQTDPESYKPFYVQTLLGEALMGKATAAVEPANKSTDATREEATQLLTSGFAELKKRIDSIPPANRQETLGRTLEILIANAKSTDNAIQLESALEEREWLRSQAATSQETPNH